MGISIQLIDHCGSRKKINKNLENDKFRLHTDKIPSNSLWNVLNAD